MAVIVMFADDEPAVVNTVYGDTQVPAAVNTPVMSPDGSAVWMIPVHVPAAQDVPGPGASPNRSSFA